MLHIIGIGDNVVDRYLYKNKMYPGGNSINVPLLAQRTGMAQAAYIGCLGTDAAGKHVLASLQAEGLEISHLRVMEGANAYSNVTLVDGDRVFTGGSAGVSHSISLNKDDEAYIASYDLIHTSVYSGIDGLLAQMKAIGPEIAYDYSDHLDIKLLEHTFAYVDFAIFSGGNHPLEALKELAKAVEQQGPKQVLITMGARGAMLYREGAFFQQGIYKIDKVVDTMGAGDSFIARYLAGFYNHEGTQESMRNAAEYAAKNCLIEGTFGYEAEIESNPVSRVEK